MKEVMAIIRMDKMNETKKALVNIGISSFTARKVLGRGKGNVDFKVLKGAKEGREEAIAQLGNDPRLIPKRLITIITPDSKVEKIIKTIIKTNQTGNRGDGKIFVMPTLDAVKIRTGEIGDKAIKEVIN